MGQTAQANPHYRHYYFDAGIFPDSKQLASIRGVADELYKVRVERTQAKLVLAKKSKANASKKASMNELQGSSANPKAKGKEEVAADSSKAAQNSENLVFTQAEMAVAMSLAGDIGRSVDALLYSFLADVLWEISQLNSRFPLAAKSTEIEVNPEALAPQVVNHERKEAKSGAGKKD